MDQIWQTSKSSKYEQTAMLCACIIQLQRITMGNGPDIANGKPPRVPNMNKQQQRSVPVLQLQRITMGNQVPCVFLYTSVHALPI